MSYNLNLHVSWARLALSDFDPRVAYWILQYAKFDHIGQLVLTPTTITPNTGNSRYQDLLAEREGVRFIYSGSRKSKFDIFYQKFDNDGRIVVAETNVSQSTTQLATAPKIESATDGTFHLVWDEDRYGMTDEIYYARIYENGKLLTSRTRVDNSTSQVQDAAICMIRSGRIFIVWADDRYRGWDIMLRSFKPIATSVQDSDHPSNPTLNYINDIQVYPSPTSGHANIRYTISEKAKVGVSIYDCSGRSVRAFPQEERFPGDYAMLWNALDDSGHRVPAGLYICRIRIIGINKSYEIARKVLVLK